MGEIRAMNREDKKRQLRNNIVQLPRGDQRGPSYGDDGDDDGGGRRPVKKSRIIVLAVLIAVLAVLFTSVYSYRHSYQFTGFDVVWEKSMRYSEEKNGDAETSEEQETSGEAKKVSESSFVNFAYFGDNMIKFTKDGATYIDASGKSIWMQSYEMKTPVISVNGDFAAIADQQGNEVYIFNKEGHTGTAKTQLPITKVTVSAKGVAAAIVEDSTAAYIFYYRKDGTPLKINVKMLLSGDGYPIDAALSPDGKQLALSVVYLKNGTMSNKVVFYDFSEIGKNINNRFVGGFEEEFEGKMAARVCYMNQDTVCAFSNKGLTFISVKNVIPDPEIITVEVEDQIRSICYSDKYAGVVVDNPTGNPYRMDIFKTDGTKVVSIEFDFLYSGVEIDGDSIILYNDEACRVYNLSGNEKFECEFDFPVSKVRVGRNRLNTLIVAGIEVMKEIKLK